jgi:hypothetical protein
MQLSRPRLAEEDACPVRAGGEPVRRLLGSDRAGLRGRSIEAGRVDLRPRRGARRAHPARARVPRAARAAAAHVRHRRTSALSIRLSRSPVLLPGDARLRSARRAHDRYPLPIPALARRRAGRPASPQRCGDQALQRAGRGLDELRRKRQPERVRGHAVEPLRGGNGPYYSENIPGSSTVSAEQFAAQHHCDSGTTSCSTRERPLPDLRQVCQRTVTDLRLARNRALIGPASAGTCDETASRCPCRFR